MIVINKKNALIFNRALYLKIFRKGGLTMYEELSDYMVENPTKFKSIDAEKLLEKEFPPKYFVINSLLTKGLSIIAGSPKIGKSWLMLDWCVRVSKGEDVWNLKTNPGVVLYLSLEDNESRIQNRLLSVADDVSGNLHFVTECSKLGENLEEQINNFVSEHKDTVLIVIDTFQMIRSSGKESSYSGDYNEVQVLKQLADKLGICILLVHHLRKLSDPDPFNEISGTTGIAGCADGLFVLKKSKRCQGSATLYCTGRDIEDREIELTFDKSLCTWQMVSDSAENPNMILPDEMVMLIEFMKQQKYLCGSNADFVNQYNLFSGKNLSARILKTMMNKWQYDLKERGITFKSFRENNVRKLEIQYDEYDGYDEN